MPGNSIIRSVTIRSNQTWTIAGIVESAYSANVDGSDNFGQNYPSRFPMFLLSGSKKVSFTTANGGYLVQNHHEAFVVRDSSNINLSADIIGSGVGTQFDAILITHSQHVTVQNSKLTNLCRIPMATQYGRCYGVTILSSLHTAILNNSVSGARGDGIALSSGYDTRIEKNHIYRNNMDGIQIGYQIPWRNGRYPIGNAYTQYVSVVRNVIEENSADCFDSANTGAPYNVWLTVTGNTCKHNGWFPPGRTDQNRIGTTDGAGINLQNVNRATASHNKIEDPAGAGLFVTGSSLFEVFENVVDKQHASKLGAQAGSTLIGDSHGILHDNRVQTDVGIAAFSIGGISFDLTIVHNQFLGGPTAILSPGVTVGYREGELLV